VSIEFIVVVLWKLRTAGVDVVSDLAGGAEWSSVAVSFFIP